MEIAVDRKYKKDGYTIGNVSVNGEFFCNSLEDKDRGLDQSMPLSRLKKMKVYGQTAIPTGTYSVKSYFWPKYRKYYPLLLDVKSFSGILIHAGKNATHTLGCILLGENKIKGGLVNGEKYVRSITSMVQNAENIGEPITITIK